MKLKLKDIIIIILIALLIILSFTFFIREGINLNKLNKLNQSNLDKEHAYELTLTQLIISTNNLWQQYQIFVQDYQKQEILLKEQEVNNRRLEDGIYGVDWSEFEVTAYTSQECGTITSIGIDLKARYAKYLNIAAVDPKVVPYGSTLLIKFADGSIKAFIATDCGGLIKGKRIDLYMTDVKEALQFGRQKLMVRVIN